MQTVVVGAMVLTGVLENLDDDTGVMDVSMQTVLWGAGVVVGVAEILIASDVSSGQGSSVAVLFHPLVGFEVIIDGVLTGTALVSSSVSSGQGSVSIGVGVMVLSSSGQGVV